MTERPNQNPSSHDRSFRRDPAREQHTRDLDQAARTNPSGPEPYDPSFDEQLAPNLDAFPQGSHIDESTPASEDKGVMASHGDLTSEELSRLSILDRGAQLEQGSVYLDLNDMGRGPFKAIGGDTAGHRNRYIAKAETDYEIWNRLVGQDETTAIERP